MIILVELRLLVLTVFCMAFQGVGMGIGQDADLRFQVEVVKFKSWWRLL
jgi:hypothetical protein